MGVNASLSTTPSVSGTTTSPSSVAASTSVGVQPQITRMAIEGIRGADGDMSWAGEWSSSSNYVANQVVYYEGSAYICIQGNSNLRPDQNATQWSLVVSKGDAGATGAAGPTGSAGVKGAEGDTGPQGPTGATGSSGSQGPQGPKGIQGDAGSSATVAVGSTTTGSAGSSASVSNSGSSSQATFNFTIPRGATGATGAQGATGPQGSQGATGPQGSTGAAGSQGSNGTAATIAVGSVSTGLPGSSASVTNAGSSSSATLNFAIPRGDTGATGEITWKGGWSNSTVYGVNEAVYYNGSSYIAIVNNQNVRPDTDTTKWNIMAQAGAEGGSISSMSDTTISGSVTDMAILAYDSNGTKWKDNNTFTGTFVSPVLLGGTF